MPTILKRTPNLALVCSYQDRFDHGIGAVAPPGVYLNDLDSNEGKERVRQV